jgi:phosphodiesterase/alkaline phosphatase D-like protein
MRGMHMHGLLLLSAIATSGGMLSAKAIHAEPTPQASIPAPAGIHRPVRIIERPSLESVKDNDAIITWKSSNPGGTEEHFGVVHYGTDPTHLTETAKSHIRLNPNHSYTVFRVLVSGLKPQTTYYYVVDSMQGNGASDGVKSRVARFTTP